MQHKFFIYNTLTRKEELFAPINPPHVGIYVCGPTVYDDPHLGHARGAVTFDILFRYLKHLGYKVRYVRNITDVGHLEDELHGEGEDRIAKKAKLEKLEPMEIVQHYSNQYHRSMDLLNVLPPSIEPLASGHIIEQQELIQKILDNGFAYIANGSVYFDLEKYSKKYNYGKLSGRRVEDLLTDTCELGRKKEKKSSLDFALWKKAGPEHIMQWSSKWGKGFPGWHLECSVMGIKYLGERYDIHGGGLDLLFPHHECEIAQSTVALGQEHVNYWMHNNMITIKDQKMSKSLKNTITLDELFTGNHEALDQAYSPMTVRFFILQAHYRSTLDFSNEALQASEKGLERLMNGFRTLQTLKPSGKSTVNVKELKSNCYEAMNRDMNCAVAISHLFDGVRSINSIKDNNESINREDLEELRDFYNTFIFDILGLKDEKNIAAADDELNSGLIKLLLNIRAEAKDKGDFTTADKIRSQLNDLGIIVKDTKDGFEWERK
jgi:cysteinyl-tRNA synthetase